jgi:hypothetical protein
LDSLPAGTRLKFRDVFERMREMGYEVHLASVDGGTARFTGRCLGREGPGKRFWLHLGSACMKAGLRWGGFDGLGAAHHGGLRRALARGEFDRAMGMKLGADPAKCEEIE